MSITPQAFQLHLSQLGNTKKYLIAYSGGVDSHVLLHLCAQLKTDFDDFKESFSAVYINHGLSPNSRQWGKHCRNICNNLGIPITIINVDGRAKKGQSPEASARIARYHAFAQLLVKNETLLAAQHLDDQAETLLLQLLRGSGVKGLSAMPKKKPFAQGFLSRPLLDYKKNDILNYAKEHQLHWIEDESNDQQCFDRNYLRHSILPLLEKHWPAVRENFAKSAGLLAESQILLDQMAASDCQTLFFTDIHGYVEYDKLLLSPTLKLLAQEQVEAQPSARLNNVLRYWIAYNQSPLPSKKILQQIISNVLLARQDAMPLVSWQRDDIYCAVRRYQDKIYLLDSELTIKDKKHYHLKKGQVTQLACNKGVIQCVSADKQYNNFAYKKLFSKTLTVRFRNGGERYRRTAKGTSRSLKHWFQEHHIPPWERDTIPLIFWGDELIQVGNSIVCEQLNVEQGKNFLHDSVIIFWQKKNNKIRDEIFSEKR